MKKLLILFTIVAFTLCGCSQKYDFSSSKAFEKSVYAQAEKEGLSKDQAESIILQLTLGPVKDMAYKDLADGKTPKGTNDEIALKYMKKAMGNKSLKQLEAELKK